MKDHQMRGLYLNVMSAVIAITGLMDPVGPRRRPNLEQRVHLDGRDFQCGKDEVKIAGESGRATELARH
jgi:hypothetical protein